MNRILVRIWDAIRWIGRRKGLLIALLVVLGIGWLVLLGLAPAPGSAAVSAAKSSEGQGERMHSSTSAMQRMPAEPDSIITNS